MLHQYGLFVSNKRASFPQKLELLDRAGVVSLDILRNLNVERNLVEHEYDVPERKRVREAIDVAKLLLLAMDKLAESIPYEAVVGTRRPAGHSVLRLEPLQGEVQLFKLTNGNGEFKTYHGIRTFTGRIRTLRGDSDERYRVASDPWHTYPLTRANAEAWSPVLRWIIDVQRHTGTHVTSIDPSTARVTVPVTLAWPIDGDRWTDFLDAATKASND
jgi:hypothetical protein